MYCEPGELEKYCALNHHVGLMINFHLKRHSFGICRAPIGYKVKLENNK